MVAYPWCSVFASGLQVRASAFERPAGDADTR